MPNTGRELHGKRKRNSWSVRQRKWVKSSRRVLTTRTKRRKKNIKTSKHILQRLICTSQWYLSLNGLNLLLRVIGGGES